MSDEDMIRRGDARRVVLAYASSYSAEEAETAIRALPAVQPVVKVAEDIEALAYRFWSIHPKDIPEPVGMPEGYKGGRRAWFYATEIRRVIAALDVQPAPAPQMRPETGMEHIARDMREGRFPERSERQMVTDVQYAPKLAEAHDEQLAVWADELMADLMLNGFMELVDHDYDTKVGARTTIIAALRAANQAKVPQHDDDPECTCCGGTGVTYQTERPCACQPPPDVHCSCGSGVTDMDGHTVHDEECPESWRSQATIRKSQKVAPAPNVAALVETVKELEKAASRVSSLGAVTGPQWTKLTIAILHARAAIAKAEARK